MNHPRRPPPLGYAVLDLTMIKGVWVASGIRKWLLAFSWGRARFPRSTNLASCLPCLEYSSALVQEHTRTWGWQLHRRHYSVRLGVSCFIVRTLTVVLLLGSYNLSSDASTPSCIFDSRERVISVNHMQTDACCETKPMLESETFRLLQQAIFVIPGLFCDEHLFISGFKLTSGVAWKTFRAGFYSWCMYTATAVTRFSVSITLNPEQCNTSPVRVCLLFFRQSRGQ